MIRRGCAFLLTLISIPVSSQVLHRNFSYPYNQVTFPVLYADSSVHTGIKPVYRITNDTLVADASVIFAERHFIQSKTEDFYFGASPLLVNEYGSGVGNHGTGLMAEASWKDRIGGQFFAEYRLLYNQHLQEDLIQHEKGIPQLGRFENGNFLTDFRGYIAAKPFSFLTIEAGRGKHFFGDGYRSMILSDFAPAYPYLKLNTSFWKLRYVNLYTKFSQWLPGADGPSTKFGATHMLSWNITKWLNLGFFESIIFEPRPGYDVQYLNPVILYRPVEYATGSADNALLGTQLKITLAKSFIVYGQLVLDEFLLNQLKADYNHWRNPEDTSIVWGWWANKYGYQAGISWFRPLGLNFMNLRFETNGARPYTYSHGSVLQSYSHGNYALAHPLGANFNEGLMIANFTKGIWFGRVKYVSAAYGDDLPGVNFGRDVILPYTDRIGDFYNTTGQGIPVQLKDLEVRAGILLHEKSALNISAVWLNRNITRAGNADIQNFFYISLTTSILNNYYDR